MTVARSRRADKATILQSWKEHWGIPVVSLYREYRPGDVEGLVVETEGGEPLALVTWYVEGRDAEIVSLNALIPGYGYGRQALRQAEAVLHELGARRLWLVTTNDNVQAIGVYLREGWRLVGVHLDHMETVRKKKPGVPTTGSNGLPLQDAFEFEKRLDR